MKFYDRKEEIDILEGIYQQVDVSGKMTVISGRRRVGKTMLALEFAKDKTHLYFFISKTSENLLCNECIRTIKDQYDLPVLGEINRFVQVFELVLQLAQKGKIVLIIDEFQEFYTINPSVYSQIQNLWDRYKKSSNIHLIFIGSVYSLMVKIFEKSHEPLFGRADRMLFIKPFPVKVIKKILLDYDSFSLDNLFVLYVVSGGIPRYLEILADSMALKSKRIFDFIIRKDSPFLNEGKNLLIEEFGSKYGIYFSILELISMGKTSRPTMESIFKKNIGGYLDRLESVYGVIGKVKPFNAKPMGRVVKYRIRDNFLNFWFRFIHKNRSALETGNFGYVLQVLERDFATYSGLLLEKLFHDLIAQSFEYNRVGNYWEKGNQNEIDLIAVNEIEKTMLVADIKLNQDKINIEKLKIKAKNIVLNFTAYKVEYKGLSLQNILDYI